MTAVKLTSQKSPVETGQLAQDKLKSPEAQRRGEQTGKVCRLRWRQEGHAGGMGTATTASRENYVGWHLVPLFDQQAAESET